jgi:hypothetical protein
MLADQNLLAQVRKLGLGDSTEDLVERYETACWLSRGRSADRSAHWQRLARELERQLRRIVRPKVENRIEA